MSEENITAANEPNQALIDKVLAAESMTAPCRNK